MSAVRELQVILLCLAGVACTRAAGPSAPGEAASPSEENAVKKPPRIDAEGLVVRVDPPETFASEGPALLTFTVANPTDRARVFCTYHTPFEGIRNDIFVVTAAGAEVPYRGMMAKRAAPGPEDFLVMPPGSARQAQVDLREGYALPPGLVTVAYRGTAISGLPDSNTATVAVTAAP